MGRRPDPAQMCVDIHAWVGGLADTIAAATHPGARPAVAGGHSGDGSGRLPRGLTQRLDDLDDGMPGARTPQGITTILTGWADAIAARRHEPRTTPPAVYLAITTDWWLAQYGDADALLDDITTAWDMLARTTGHGDQTDTQHRCPACGGRLTQAATTRGLTDWRACTTCDTWWPDTDTIDAARHHTITTTTDGDHWVTRQHALTLHPDVSPARLRQWVHRGHVRTRGRLVSLTDINQRTGTAQ